MTPPAAGPPPRFVGALGSTLSHRSIGLVLSPPPDVVAPAIGAGGAYRACWSSAQCPRQDVGPIIYLASATWTLSGHDHTPRLLWVLRWDDVPVSPAGPPGSPQEPVPALCLTFVDAETGGVVGSYQSTEPDSAQLTELGA